MIPPTPLMAECLTAIRQLTVDGVPPSLDELAHHLGRESRGSLHSLLASMRDRGLITWERGRARTLQVTPWPEGLDAISTAGLMQIRRQIEGVLASRVPA